MQYRHTAVYQLLLERGATTQPRTTVSYIDSGTAVLDIVSALASYQQAVDKWAEQKGVEMFTRGHNMCIRAYIQTSKLCSVIRIAYLRTPKPSSQ